MLRRFFIRTSLDMLGIAKVDRWLPPASDASGFVMTLHHVRPARISRFNPQALLSITPEFLDRFLGHFVAKGWCFVSPDELALCRRTDAGARRVAITLDDGYRDNLEYAWPVFRKHGVPFTIYVCTGFADRTAELWWEALEQIIANTDSMLAPGERSQPSQPTRSVRQKQAMFDLWHRWLTSVADEKLQRRAIRELAADHGLDLADLARRMTMDWDEIRRIAADPLCSIGAHTVTHPALARLPADDALREILESCTRISHETGRPPRTLAFPYGYAAAAGPRDAALAERAGLAASFSARLGFVPRSGSRHGLPRVPMSGLYQKVRYLEVLLSSGLWKLRQNWVT